MSLWERLPEEIVDQILNQVVFLSDFIRFGSVCKRWYAIFLQNKQPRIQRCNNEVPFLFITPAPNNKLNSSSTTTLNRRNVQQLLPNHLFHMFQNKCYNSMSTGIPFTQILSASYGWLATIIQDNPRDLITINLKNPMTGNTISLPPLVDKHYYSVWNISAVVLSCNPCINPDNCVVAYYSEGASINTCDIVGFIRLGDKTWNKFTMVATCKKIKAILFHNGQLYVLDSIKNLFAIHCHWDSNNGDKCYFQCYHIVQMSDFQASQQGLFKLYLVESVKGEVLKIEKNKDNGYTLHSTDIMVYKLVISGDDGKGHWVRIQGGLDGNDDGVLFLSDRNVICSKSPGLQADPVYVFDTYKTPCEGECFEIRRIISLKEKREAREQYRCVTLKSWSAITDSQPLWINPTLQ